MITTTNNPSPQPEYTHEPITVSSQSFGTGWDASISTLRNSRTDCFKPNEDRVIVDPVRQSVVIADGITRTKADDGTYPLRSPSAEVAQLFCETVSAAIAATEKMSQPALREIIAEGNRVIAQYNREHVPVVDYAQRDLAGIAAITGIVDNDRLWIASIADCVCLSANSLRVDRIAWEMTSQASEEYKRIGEIEARRTLRNNPNSKYAYGAFTGEETALRFVFLRCFPIGYAQRLVFASDGLLELAQRTPTIFRGSTPSQIMAAASQLERETKATDDKTIVVLDRKPR
jgi:serine/threonine protein phosphatase PrpC